MTTTQATAKTKAKKPYWTNTYGIKTKKTKTKKNKATKKMGKTTKTRSDFTAYEWGFLTFILDSVVAATKGKTTVTQVKFKETTKPVTITIGVV